jgi:hypothetical protein
MQPAGGDRASFVGDPPHGATGSEHGFQGCAACELHLLHPENGPDFIDDGVDGFTAAIDTASVFHVASPSPFIVI